MIEGLGGIAIAVYHDKRALFALTRPHFFTNPKYGRIMPRFSPPSHPRDLLYYTSKEKRGYLAPSILPIFKSALPSNRWQYIFRKNAVIENEPIKIPYVHTVMPSEIKHPPHFSS